MIILEMLLDESNVIKIFYRHVPAKGSLDNGTSRKTKEWIKRSIIINMKEYN